MGLRRKKHQCQFLLKLGLAPGCMPHILTVVLQPKPTAPCPATGSPLHIFSPRVRGARQGVVHTGGTANQGLGEGLGVLQHCVCWQSSNRGFEALIWRSRSSWHSVFCKPTCCSATQSPGPG